MIRLLVRIGLIGLAVAVTLYFADRPGTVRIVWQGRQLDTSLAVLLIALLFVVLIAWLVAALYRLAGAPRRMMRRRREARRLHGYRALTDGLVAIAAGDALAAERLWRQAEQHFVKGGHQTPPLTRLVAAQAAQLKGDEATAREHFTRLLDTPETEFLGLRGLIVQALKDGDDTTALRLTERAATLRPDTAWVLQSRLALETRSGDWRGAEATLKQALRRKAVSAEDGKHYRQTLLVAQAREAEQRGFDRDAVARAISAYRLDRTFAPAALEAAHRLRRAGRAGKALKVLETNWRATGHPAIAASYVEAQPGETPADRLKRGERLIALRPAELEGHLATAQVALDAGLWGEARRHLSAAGASGPGPFSARLCRLMARLEAHEHHDEAAATSWRDREASAAAEPAWVCATCSAEADTWSPLCSNCQGFDTLVWRVPDRAVVRPDASHAMTTVGLEPPAPLRPPGAPSGGATETAARHSGG